MKVKIGVAIFAATCCLLGMVASSADCEQRSSDCSFNGTECSGRGSCICGQCQCEPNYNTGEFYTGRFCECDSTLCESSYGVPCGGADHGTCECGTCNCHPPWTGPHCECDGSQISCIRPLDGSVCSNHGKCSCGFCACEPGFIGRYCHIAPPDYKDGNWKKP